MNLDSRFFDYKHCYEFYLERIDSLRQHVVNGEIMIAKPAFLVAIIDGIDNNVYNINRFVISEWLEDKYKRIATQYTKESQFDNITGIEKPFWHLESDGFWNIIYSGDRLDKSQTPSKAWLKQNVEYAFFEESFWILLQNGYWRSKIREYIVNTKLDYKKKNNPKRYDERKRLGNLIAQIREEKGMSQEELAGKTGYTIRNIESIEVGKYSVTYDVLSNIASALGKKIALI